MIEEELLFAVTVLEAPASGRLEYDDDHPVMRERALLNARYQELKRANGFTEASRLARAEWLGRFLAGRDSQLEVLLAWESGELSEGEACRLLGAAAGAATDPVTARGMKEDAVVAARKRWELWRASNPPSPGSGP
jgi:hypothetical protein